MVKRIVHQNGWKYAHPHAIQDLDEFVNIMLLAHQWILCSEWAPSEWADKTLSKQLIKTSQ